MIKRIIVALLIAGAAPLLMAPQILNHSGTQSRPAQPPLLCQWLPFVCR